jgi:hypothetical protein
MVYLRARIYDTRLGRFTTPDPLAHQPSPAPITSPYSYANNDPLNLTDPLGLFSFGSFVSSIAHSVSHAIKHVVHAVTGTVTRATDIVAGAAAHAYDSVASGLASLDAIAHKDAAYLFHKVHDAAASVIDTARSAVSRSVGMVESAATATVSWIKKHNQIIGKVGSFLTNVSGYLALAGAIIAPIPGLDALTPVLEGAALITGVGGLAAQGLAKAAGDRNITYGDLFTAALAAIPGGGDAEDAEAAVNTATHFADDGAEEAAAPNSLFHYTDEAGLKGITDSGELNASSGPVNARYGPGQYLTDVPPEQVGARKLEDLTPEQVADGQISRGQLAARLYGRATNWSIGRTSRYLEIDVSDLDLENPRPGVWRVPGDSPLDLAGRILRTGTTPF